MTEEARSVERLLAAMSELLHAGGSAETSADARSRLAQALIEFGGELRRLADDPGLRPIVTGTAEESAPPLAQLLREVGAALGTPIAEEPDTEALAARLDALLAGFTGARAPEEDEMQARVRASAERAIAESLRKRGITALGSSEP
jgi:hypothetical protein